MVMSTGLVFVGAFLLADSLLALVFGRRYMLWGLGCAPAFYRNFITRLSELPSGQLLAIKLAECVLGIAVLWVAQ